ncbi:MAG TPA: hypothetical protein VEA58_10705 [Anaerovoracaceae bacterium]|nr:hypothetical protein [Anaerovoracaceae bacterium]
MKRAGTIVSLTILMILMSFSFCFASGLELLDSYPKDGSNDARPENFLVKLYFNEDVSAKEVQAANESAFTFKDSKGKELKVRALYDAKKPNEIWVLVGKTLDSDSSYKLYISGDLKMANGDTLGEDKVISLKTRNLSTDNNVNMGLMGVMMVGMIVFTSMSAKRQLKKHEEEEKATSDAKVNPYKLAKETGTSVEDAVAKTEKERQKARAQAEKKNKGKAQTSAITTATIDTESASDAKKVTGPRPISVTGSTYITGRKEKAEKEREKNAGKASAGTTRPKNATGKSKNKKSNKK